MTIKGQRDRCASAQGKFVGRTAMLAAASLMSAFAVSSNVSAASLIKGDFSNTSDLMINNDAAGNVNSIYDPNPVLRLTPAQNNKRGSAFSLTQIDVSTGFSTFFSFRLTDSGGALPTSDAELGADGFAFVLQNQANNAGGPGDQVGYGGINPSVAIEFDTFPNGHDPFSPTGGQSNHIGIMLNGNVANHPAATPVTTLFNNGDLQYAWIDYDDSTNLIEVRHNTSAVRPASPTLTGVFDIDNILGQTQAFVGFTAGTGANYNNHDIIQWEYRDNSEPPIADPATMALTANVDLTEAIVGAGAVGNITGTIANVAAINPTAGNEVLDYALSGTGNVSALTAPSGNAVVGDPATNYTGTFTVGNVPGVQVETITASDVDQLNITNDPQTADVSVNVLAHANASFDGGSDSNILSIDFGEILGSFKDETFDIFALIESAGFTADLDFDSITPVSGDTALFSVVESLFTGMEAGNSQQYTARFSPLVAGDYSAQYTLNFSDEDLLGEANNTLILNVEGTLVPEPASLALLGLAGLLVSKRRR